MDMPCGWPPCCTANLAVLASPSISGGSRELLRRPWRSEFPLGFQWFAPPFRDGGEVKATSVSLAGENPIIPGMAGRYATALFERALENRALESVKKDLDQFDALVAGSTDLNRLVRSPVFDADEQLKALSAILAKAGITGLAANFLRVITTNRRLFAVRDMIRGYRTLVARHKGEVTAQITVAEQLNDKNLDALKSALKSVTGGRDIDLDVKVEPAIIGGLIVKVGSRMVDSSLRTKLNSIKLAMKEAR